MLQFKKEARNNVFTLFLASLVVTNCRKRDIRFQVGAYHCKEINGIVRILLKMSNFAISFAFQIHKKTLYYDWV